MKKLLQINVTANWGSTGKIVEEIGKLAIKDEFESWIAFGRGNPKSESSLIRIGNDWDMKFHGLQTRLFDYHGLASKTVTKKFINQIKEIKPDIIHLHNIHGYYINYKILFNYLKEWGGPVVWTLHDCWTFTGHCPHFTFIKCDKWQTQCFICPEKRSYPASLFLDRSKQNFIDKKESFQGLPNLTLVPVSDWLKDNLQKSFLKDYPINVIKNGIDLDVFKIIPSLKHNSEKIILGVSSVWTERKGLNDFVKLRYLLPLDYKIILVGLSKKQIENLPKGIIGIERTENVQQLVKLYNEADVFVNPSAEETLGMTTIEALACGTPVVVYNSTAVPEPVSDTTGKIINFKDIDKMAKAITDICEFHPFKSSDCRKRAENYFDKNNAFQAYIDLYNSILE